MYSRDQALSVHIYSIRKTLEYEVQTSRTNLTTKKKMTKKLQNGILYRKSESF